MKSKIHRTIESLIGKEVQYEDFLGYRVIGTIKYAEADPRLEDDVVFLYLTNDEDLSSNDKIKVLGLVKNSKNYIKIYNLDDNSINALIELY